MKGKIAGTLIFVCSAMLMGGLVSLLLPGLRLALILGSAVYGFFIYSLLANCES